MFLFRHLVVMANPRYTPHTAPSTLPYTLGCLKLTSYSFPPVTATIIYPGDQDANSGATHGSPCSLPPPLHPAWLPFNVYSESLTLPSSKTTLVLKDILSHVDSDHSLFMGLWVSFLGFSHSSGSDLFKM